MSRDHCRGPGKIQSVIVVLRILLLALLAFGGSTGLAWAITTSTTFSATPTTLARGQSVTFSATVTPVGGGGTVAFKDGGGAGTQLGFSVPIDGGGNASLVFNTTSLTIGAHSIVAVYSPDPISETFTGSTSASVTLTITVPATTCLLYTSDAADE